jgi:glycine dehydrogenase
MDERIRPGPSEFGEDSFLHRHLGPRDRDATAMLELLGCDSIEELIAEAVPAGIRNSELPGLGEPLSEAALLARARRLASMNRVFRSYIGMGYSGTEVPPVIQRNILENPAWYTAYTPYQSEVSQGRLEALLNFQTMIIDLTGLEVANASLLDEGTAAAEAMSLFYEGASESRSVFLVDARCHPQTIAVVEGRGLPLGIEVRVGDPDTFEFDESVFGVLLALPGTDGEIVDPRRVIERAHAAGALVAIVADLLSLTLLTPPGELGADVAVGSSQRFGVPIGFGGPHAAYFATTEALKRGIPGRIIGVSRDVEGRPALRMALQTREQHIRRERATSNICTAQVLLAVMASMYAVYHGPRGLRRIAERVHARTRSLAHGLRVRGHEVLNRSYFDTVRTRPVNPGADEVLARAVQGGVNLRDYGDGTIGISLDETVSEDDVSNLLEFFSTGPAHPGVDGSDQGEDAETGERAEPEGILPSMRRTSSYLDHPVFNQHRSETEMLRYMRRLEARDLSLRDSMIPLGSCTMKLNPTSAMLPISLSGFSSLHPFAPLDQTLGYHEVIGELEGWLAGLSGLPAVSLQPNSGAQGEYAGLLVIRAYHAERQESHRRVCLIPQSAHGTNPASAVMAGMKVVVVACDELGNIDVDDLREKAEAHANDLAALMITYPSTHGVFEERVREVCEIIHDRGGQVYLDGANLNAQVGICRPGDYGADVCHINLHKTFAIPHGGGGPGMGPICAAEHLRPFLPGHPVVPVGGDRAVPPVSAAPWGSASILLISWAYIALLGREGLRRSSETAILNANYMAGRLQEHFPVLYRGSGGRVAHEFILDLRPLRRATGITETDVAKRLMDYGFHAPTMSWPVPGTMMVEPTESESKEELDRFCDALIAIREEIAEIERGEMEAGESPLRHAPHTAEEAVSGEWSRPYSRERAVFPAPWTRDWKFWPPVSRVDNVYGDRNLMCSCPPPEAWAGR